MKKILAAACLALVSPALAQPAAPASPVPNTGKDWAVIVMTADVARPAEVAWTKIDGKNYCGAAVFLGTSSCVLKAGTGDVGTNRLLNGTIEEVLVARTSLSYSYAQQFSPIFYHGTLAVEPVSATTSRIVYTLIYDQAPLATPEAKAANRETRRARFQAGVDKMAAAANAP